MTTLFFLEASPAPEGCSLTSKVFEMTRKKSNSNFSPLSFACAISCWSAWYIGGAICTGRLKNRSLKWGCEACNTGVKYVPQVYPHIMPQPRLLRYAYYTGVYVIWWQNSSNKIQIILLRDQTTTSMYTVKNIGHCILSQRFGCVPAARAGKISPNIDVFSWRFKHTTDKIWVGYF